jgi:hypothetical protein
MSEERNVPPSADALPPDRAPLGLPAAPLARRRARRSIGEEQSSTLDELEPRDRALVRDLYEGLGRLERPAPGPGGPAAPAFGRNELIALVRHVGLVTTRRGAPPRVVASLRDARSGALPALFEELVRGRAGAADGGGDATALFARDHRKLLRGAFLDLDKARRRDDLVSRPHDAARLLAAFRASRRRHGGAGALAIDGRYEGPVAASCAELGALERALYNVLNYVRRHAGDGRVELRLSAEPPADPYDARVVVATLAAGRHRRALREQLDRGLGPLLDGGRPRESPLDSLWVAAALISGAYGLGQAAESAVERYVGADLLGDRLVAWLHWPLPRPARPDA